MKYSIVTNTALIITACLGVSVVAAVILLTGVAGPPVSQSPFAERTEQTQTFHAASVEQHVSVAVTENTSAFTAGETLSDTSLYPIHNASNPTLTARATVDTAEIENFSMRITYEAVRSSEQSSPFYSKTIPLATTHPDSTTANITATVPIDEVLAERAAISREFGARVVVTPRLTTELSYEYETQTRDPAENALVVGGAIEEVGNLYSLPSESDRVTHRTGSATTGQPQSSTLFHWLISVCGLSALFLAVVTAVAKNQLDEDELARTLQWERFRDWVTEVESFTPHTTTNTVEVSSLSDLVNLAIDTNRRVLYHRPVDEYLVIEGKLMYKYVPESSEKTGATEFFGLSENVLDDTQFPRVSDQPTDGPLDESQQ